MHSWIEESIQKIRYGTNYYDDYNINDHYSLNNKKITITKKNGSFVINGIATIDNKPIQASNGVIYVINNVLIPPNTKGYKGEVIKANQPR